MSEGLPPTPRLPVDAEEVPSAEGAGREGPARPEPASDPKVSPAQGGGVGGSGSQPPAPPRGGHARVLWEHCPTDVLIA